MSAKWLTVEDVLENLKITRSTWDKWRAKGKTPPVVRLPNGQLRISFTEYIAWLSALEEAA